MASAIRCLAPTSILTGWDFSTGAAKCLAFDLTGRVLAEVRFPTDLYIEGDARELSLLLLEGQARASVRGIAARLRELGRLEDWVGGGISATHHTSGRVDSLNNPIRRAICWHDQSLPLWHARGLERIGGPEFVQRTIGGPWASRYSLTHLVKDEVTLTPEQWAATAWILPHGPLSGGYLTGNFQVTSVSSAASTGMMDLRSNRWARDMLNCLASDEYRQLAWRNLPEIIDMNTPLGVLSESIALDAGLPPGVRPLIFPTLDDQAAGLVGGGAVDSGQVAIILGNSAVVNSSSDHAPPLDTLDAMKLNWGPYLWMRCYNNGAQFLDEIVGKHADFEALEKAAQAVPAGCDGYSIWPFALGEPSRGVTVPRLEWHPSEPSDPGIRFRASLEALAYLIAMAFQEHQQAGQQVTRVSVSGGIAKSPLMCEILASVLNVKLERLKSNEGTALGAAVVALAGMESYLRKQQGIDEPFTTADAVTHLVQVSDPVLPRPEWLGVYQQELARFERGLKG